MPLLLPCLELANVPTATAAIFTDSTLKDFRHSCFLALRRAGFDLVTWQARGGAWETQVAEMACSAPHHDLALFAPNCNRLSRQKLPRRPSWLAPAACHIGIGAVAAGERSCCFVGNAALSPSLDADIFQPLHTEFTSLLRHLHLRVVTDAPGVRISDDGLHWNAASHAAVQDLIEVMAREATPTSAIPLLRPPNWTFVLHPDSGRYYPYCLGCKAFHNDSHTHVQSRRHKENCFGDLMYPPPKQVVFAVHHIPLPPLMPPVHDAAQALLATATLSLPPASSAANASAAPAPEPIPENAPKQR